MQLAFYKGRHRGLPGWFDAAVRWWTRGPYSHVELVLDDGTCWSSSARDGGVRTKAIDLGSGNWDLVPVVQDAAAARAWFAAHAGAGYDYLGLFGFVWRRSYGAGSRWFCSEAVAAALGYRDAWRFDPNTLAVAVARSGGG